MSRFSFIGRKRSSQDYSGSRSGYVSFDDRGNAIFQYHSPSLEDDGARSERLRQRALANPTLALVDDRPEDPLTIVNAEGLRMGYNPYESGCLVRDDKQKRKQKDLRALSKWIEQQRELERLLHDKD